MPVLFASVESNHDHWLLTVRALRSFGQLLRRVCCSAVHTINKRYTSCGEHIVSVGLLGHYLARTSGCVTAGLRRYASHIKFEKLHLLFCFDHKWMQVLQCRGWCGWQPRRHHGRTRRIPQLHSFLPFSRHSPHRRSLQAEGSCQQAQNSVCNLLW
jgi:hypothetical protein